MEEHDQNMQGAGSEPENETQRLARQLTDDRANPELLVFEKTWGHRLLAGLSVSMFIVAFVTVVYCGWRLAGLYDALGTEDVSATFGFLLYTVGIALGACIVPPAILGIYVAKHPRWSAVGIVAAIAAFVILACFAGLAMTIPQAQAFSVGLYTCVGAVFPALYLAAAIKIHISK